MPVTMTLPDPAFDGLQVSRGRDSRGTVYLDIDDFALRTRVVVALRALGFETAKAASRPETPGDAEAQDVAVIALHGFSEPSPPSAEVPVVYLGEWPEAEVGLALPEGPAAYLHLDATGAELAAAIEAVRVGLTVFAPGLRPGAVRQRSAEGTSDVGAEFEGEHLTQRELEVVRLMALGLPNKGIAHELGISEHTAKFHVNAILQKLGAQRRIDAVVRAARLGIVDL